MPAAHCPPSERDTVPSTTRSLDWSYLLVRSGHHSLLLVSPLLPTGSLPARQRAIDVSRRHSNNEDIPVPGWLNLLGTIFSWIRRPAATVLGFVLYVWLCRHPEYQTMFCVSLIVFALTTMAALPLAYMADRGEGLVLLFHGRLD